MNELNEILREVQKRLNAVLMILKHNDPEVCTPSLLAELKEELHQMKDVMWSAQQFSARLSLKIEEAFHLLEEQFHV